MIDTENKQLIFDGKNVSIIIDKNNNPWLKGKDIADILKYIDTKDAFKKHVDIDGKMKYEEIFRGGILLPLTFNEKNTIFINEAGLYSLILSSKSLRLRYLKNGLLKKFFLLLENLENIRLKMK